MPRLSYNDMAHELAKLAYGKMDWLRRFSGDKTKRPDHEIETKRQELEVLQQAQSDYEKAAAKASAA